MNDATEQFRAAILAALGHAPDLIEPGRLHRFSTNGTNDKSGWCRLFEDGRAGVFGDFRDGTSSVWAARRLGPMTPAQRKAYQQQMQAARQLRDKDKQQRQQQAAQLAARRWQAAKPVGPEVAHPYLTHKGIHAHSVRLDGDALLIPMRDTTGALHGLQTIGPDGEKRFQPGARVKGCYYTIGQPDDVLCVTEGFATGASIHEATGHAVAVAFDAGNLLPVALALREKYPALRLILAADDDWKTDGNPGVSKATEAAQAVRGWLAKPTFPQGRGDKDTDFNDLHRCAGLDAVAMQLKKVLQML